jgi:hypothetical protein
MPAFSVTEKLANFHEKKTFYAGVFLMAVAMCQATFTQVKLTDQY